MVLVDIREVSDMTPLSLRFALTTSKYYTDKATQDMKPGKKGISLSIEQVCRYREATPMTEHFLQWDVLKSAFKEVRQDNCMSKAPSLTAIPLRSTRKLPL